MGAGQEPTSTDVAKSRLTGQWVVAEAVVAIWSAGLRLLLLGKPTLLG